MALKKFFILATKTVEVRGYVHARSPSDARERVKSCWHIHDVGTNEVTVRTTSSFAKDKAPTISEYESPIKILHVEKEE